MLEQFLRGNTGVILKPRKMATVIGYDPTDTQLECICRVSLSLCLLWREVHVDMEYGAGKATYIGVICQLSNIFMSTPCSSITHKMLTCE
jgi:hypothetical protein